IPTHARHVILFETEMDRNAARKFVDAGKERCGGICAIFLGNEEHGWQYVIGSRHMDTKALLSEFHGRFPGKGGGKPEMVQGTVQGGASETDIRSYFESNE
ncbi:MAG: hypothetical protein LUE86_09055, partial [Clostridiales bacterium]|nr:hypothetical protein [Clostridiales bacterium]